MSGDRGDWFCSKCGKYSDPQSLDYKTGECWNCQDGILPQAPPPKVEKPSAPERWGVYCSAAEAGGCLVPKYKADSMSEARRLLFRADAECQTPGSTHTIRKIQP